MSDTISPRLLRDAFSAFATGVTVVSALRPDGEPVGVTANSFASVSLEPPLILWCIARESTSAAAFEKGRAFAVTILGEREKEVALRFANRNITKFPDGIIPGRHGPSPVIPGTHPCRLDCTVDELHYAGDHLIIIGRVQAIERRGGQPLAFHDGKFAEIICAPAATPIDVWDPSGIALPTLFSEPFE